MAEKYIPLSAALSVAAAWCPDDDGSVGKTGDLREMLDEIEAIEPADVRPVVRGHWVRKEHPSPIVEAFCSNCGDPALRAYGHPARTNYCSNCGADMRPEGGAENGENLH